MCGKYQNCKLLSCIVPSRIFNEGELYPLYHIDGYAYILMLDVVNRKPVFYALDSYEDDTYKWENAVFKEAVI